MFYSALTLKLANPFGLLRGYRSSVFFLALKLLIIFFLLCSFCRILINHLHRTQTCKSKIFQCTIAQKHAHVLCSIPLPGARTKAWDVQEKYGVDF